MVKTSAKEWKFHTYEDDEKKKNSSSDKHFAGQELHRSLPRELIQNSIDAISNTSDPVTVKIKIKEIAKSACSPYLEGLKGHYKASYGKEMSLVPKVPFLILEDFNTTGLEGEKRKDFLYGDNMRSSDSISSGGSHGIGKVVFYMSSRIKTIFVYSLYAGGDGSCFAGSCTFKTHKMDDKEYKEDGTLILNTDAYQRFIKDLFSREDEKGLSIAIPMPEDDLTIEKLAKAVVKEYYYPIVNGKLIVELGDCRIDDAYIMNQKGQKENLLSDYITSPNDYVSIDIGDKYTSKSNSPISDGDTKRIIEKFEEKEGTVFVKCNFSVALKERQRIEEGYLILLITRKEDEESENFDFWREHVLISDAAQRNKRSSRYIAVTLVNGEGNGLRNLLRMLENPSHTKWDYKTLSLDVKETYRHSRITDLVRFVTQLPHEITSRLRNSEIKLDAGLFRDIFPARPTLGGKRTSDNLSPDMPDLPHPNSNFSVRENRKNNGFILSLSEQGKQNEISGVDVTVAYGTNKGDPFKNYDIRDFDLHTHKTRVEPKNSGKITTKKENRMSCEIRNTDFTVSLYGFDPDRELKIDIKEQT